MDSCYETGVGSFTENDAWEVVERPENSTVVRCKWVLNNWFFKINYGTKLD